MESLALLVSVIFIGAIFLTGTALLLTIKLSKVRAIAAMMLSVPSFLAGLMFTQPSLSTGSWIVGGVFVALTIYVWFRSIRFLRGARMTKQQ